MDHEILPRQGTLLVIDDMPNNIKVLLKFLNDAGFKVLAAQNGKQGIEIAEYAKPDLILLDVMMPGLNGFETCHLLKSQTSTQEIPIIFITALDNTLDKVKGFNLGAVDYVTKPLQYEEVLARVTTHLTLRQQRQQILEQKQLLQERTIELEKHNLELDAFAYTVAHNLKNPLNAIMVLSELLLTDCVTSKSHKTLNNLKVIIQAGQQMFNIINAILLLAGVSKRSKVQIELLNMKSLVNHVILERLHNTLQEYHATIEITDHWPMALGYAPWLEEVWFNYLTNGCKYGGHPPKLQIGGELLRNNKARFWVKDNGIGLDSQSQAQLFTPFTRLHQKTVEGHGLGLVIVKQIIEKLGGEVGVESIAGQGSQFYFTLPVVINTAIFE